VTFIPEPAELGDRASLRERYAEFLKPAGIARLPVTPDTSEVQVHRVMGQDGSIAWVANSWGETRTVTFDAGPEVGLTIAAEHGGMVQFGPDGDIETVIAGGPLTIDGRTVCEGPGYLLRSLGGEDIRSAKQVILLPLEPGTVRLARTRETAARLATFVDGEWGNRRRAPAQRGWRTAAQRHGRSGDPGAVDPVERTSHAITAPALPFAQGALRGSRGSMLALAVGCYGDCCASVTSSAATPNEGGKCSDYLALNQSGPTPAEQRSGTASSRACSITSTSTAAIASACAAGVSITSSSWICKSKRMGSDSLLDPCLQVHHREFDQVRGAALHDRVDRQTLGQRADLRVAVVDAVDSASSAEDRLSRSRPAWPSSIQV
jgi:hypothetical protein